MEFYLFYQHEDSDWRRVEPAREDKKEENNQLTWREGGRFSVSRMGLFPHPANGGVKPGEKDGEREKARGRRRGGCSRRAL